MPAGSEPQDPVQISLSFLLPEVGYCTERPTNDISMGDLVCITPKQGHVKGTAKKCGRENDWI